MLIPSIPVQHRALLPDGRLSGPMPWVIAVLMFLTLLGAAGGILLARSAAAIGQDIAGRATIQIVEANPVTRAALTGQIRRLAEAQPYVQRARTVEREEMAALLDQWFGSGATSGGSLLGDIPLPALIDVDFVGRNQTEGVARLRTAVAAVAPQARVIPHAEWLGPVATMIRSLAWIAAALVVMLTGATIAIVMLTARSALGTHYATIEILHLIGATDTQITRLFQRRIAIDTAYGIALGTAAAVAVMLVLALQFSRVSSGLAGGADLGWAGIAGLLALPLVGITVAALTARWTLMKALRTIL